MRKIALEEHFLSPGFEDYWLPTMGGVDQKAVSGLFARLQDFGDTWLKAMDSGGIARAVLSISGPGEQVAPDAATAPRRATEANDFLAGEVVKRPDRYSGFGHLPMQDAHAAADELERCVRDLKFCGAMINGHTNGEYLDHPSLHPFWERAEALQATIYIHPTSPELWHRRFKRGGGYSAFNLEIGSGTMLVPWFAHGRWQEWPMVVEPEFLRTDILT